MIGGEAMSMKALEEIYKDVFFRKRQKALSWRVPFVCNALRDLCHPESAIDVGCAVGDLVLGFMERGIEAYGVEGCRTAFPHLVCERDRVILHDLRTPYNPGRKFDLVVCFEVVEHIEPEYEKILCETLETLTGKNLVISAAPPGQEGTYHVNCKPHAYWVDLFKGMGFEFDNVGVAYLKKRWEPYRRSPGIKAYYYNVLVFKRP